MDKISLNLIIPGHHSQKLKKFTSRFIILSTTNFLSQVAEKFSNRKSGKILRLLKFKKYHGTGLIYLIVFLWRRKNERNKVLHEPLCWGEKHNFQPRAWKKQKIYSDEKDRELFLFFHYFLTKNHNSVVHELNIHRKRYECIYFQPTVLCKYMCRSGDDTIAKKGKM